MADDYSATTSTTGNFTVGGSFTGNIETANDRDWFAITLSAGHTYQFDLEGSQTSNGTLSDPYIRGLYTNNGSSITGTVDDDGGIGLNSLIQYRPLTTRTYYVSAGAYSSHTGSYSLGATDVTFGKLTIYIDKEEFDNLHVGHAWFEFDTIKGSTNEIDSNLQEYIGNSCGFYPDDIALWTTAAMIVFFPETGLSVATSALAVGIKGDLNTNDTNHYSHVDYKEEFYLTKEQFINGLEYVEDIDNNPGLYNICFRNCVDIAANVMRESGLNISSSNLTTPSSLHEYISNTSIYTA